MRTKAEIERAVDFYAERLGLRDWLIRVDWETPATDGSYAEVTTVDGRRMATVTLSEDWASWSDVVVKNTLIHELLHVQHDPANHIVQEDLREHLAPTTYLAVWQAYRRAHEYATDGLAVALTRLLPPPSEPEENDE